MKLLLDQGVSRKAVGLLQPLGIDAVHVSAYATEEASDEEILDRARTEGRVVVTIDSDFHAILALSNAATPSVIRLCMASLTGQNVASLLATHVTQIADDLDRMFAAAQERADPPGVGMQQQANPPAHAPQDARQDDEAPADQMLPVQSHNEINEDNIKQGPK